MEVKVMNEFLKGLKVNYTVSALLCVALGLVLLIWPGTTTQVVCMVLGAALVVYGVLQIVFYLANKDRNIAMQGMMVFGIVVAVIGVWILLKPEMIIMAVPVIVGILIVIHGIHNVVQAIALKKDGYTNWWVAFLLGVITVTFGVVLICNPFTVVDTVVRLIGAFLIYDGLSDIWILSRVSKVKRNAEKIVDANFVDITDEDQ